MGAILTFYISFGAIIALLLLRVVELWVGSTVFAHVRERADRVVIHVAVYISRHAIPRARHSLISILFHSVQTAILFIIRSMQTFERKLIFAFNTVRSRYTTLRSRVPSAYMQAVSESRKKDSPSHALLSALKSPEEK